MNFSPSAKECIAAYKKMLREMNHESEEPATIQTRDARDGIPDEGVAQHKEVDC